MIRYPKALKTGSTIGVTAPSSGLTPPYYPRLELIFEHLRAQGYRIVEGNCLRHTDKHVSGSAEARAAELMRFWMDPTIDAIIPPWGGARALELLPLLDFEVLKKNPTWYQGFSDNSTLMFAITVATDIATSHGRNLMDSVPLQTDELTVNAWKPLHVLAGGSFTQKSSARWQSVWADFQKDPGAPYNLAEKTEWKQLKTGSSAKKFAGRLIGGCLDPITMLVGTPYGKLPEFVRRHQDKGVILFLENSSQAPTNVLRYLTHMKFCGWFEGLNGIMLGRSNAKDAENPSDLFYAEALREVLGGLTIPVIYDCDIGHRVPQMTLINGAYAQVEFQDGAGRVEQSLI